MTACAAAALPLASRDEILTVVPATLDESEIVARLAQAEATAILKLGRHVAKVRRALEHVGLLDRAVYVEHATLGTQRVARLACIDPKGALYFSMALVHRRGAPNLGSASETTER